MKDDLRRRKGAFVKDLKEASQCRAPVGDPLRRLRRRLLHGRATREEETIVRWAHVAHGDAQPHGEQEGEEQLVLLEERAADVLVQHLLETNRRSLRNTTEYQLNLF